MERRVRRALTVVMATAVGLSVVAAGGPQAEEASAAADPAVWVGSPVKGRWAEYDGCPASYSTAKCSLPTAHHTPYLGAKAWSVDLQVGKGAEVRVYAAPKDTRLNSRIHARIDAVAPACASGVVSQGGRQVTVGFYLDKAKLIGRATYAHIEVAAGITKGKWVNRWGTRLGTVGSYKGNPCWGGVHLHMEMHSAQSYACFNKGYVAHKTDRTKSTAVGYSNFFGFVGGSYAGPRKPCP